MAVCEIKQKDKWPCAKSNKIHAKSTATMNSSVSGKDMIQVEKDRRVSESELDGNHSFNAVVC